MKKDKDSVDWARVAKNVAKENIRTYWRPYGIPAIIDVDASRISGAEQMPRWRDPGKVLISTAINGAFFTKAENPNQPILPEEIIASAEACINAGAQVIHVHARDKAGYNVLDDDLFADIIGELRSRHPSVAFDACLVAVDDAECAALKRVLKRRLIDAVPVNTTAIILGDNLFVKPPHAIIEKTRLILEAGAKPQIAVYTDGDVDNARRLLFDSGMVGTGMTWLLMAGLPGCSPMFNAEHMIDGLMRQVRLIRYVDPEAVILVCAGGRASLYLATLAITLGLHVRVGMEDTVWKWPHRDDLIETNVDAYRAIRRIAEELGREEMSSADYRRLCGIEGSTGAAIPARAAS